MTDSVSTTKNVLITGCSSGIGHELALSFHRLGHRVWATARNIQTLTELDKEGIQCLELDVLDHAQIQSVVDKVLATDNKLDILVNNAGYGAMGPLVETSDAELRRQFDTNVFAPMALVREVVPAMQQQRQGMIINIGSVVGEFVTPFAGSYSASKAAINMLSDALRMELKPFGIQVVTVQPGAVRSQFASNADKALDQIWQKDSIYQPIEVDVRKRAQASQDNPTEVEDFCRALVAKIESGKPLNVIRLANGSKTLPLVKVLLPTRWLEWILGRAFGLNKLAQKSK